MNMRPWMWIVGLCVAAPCAAHPGGFVIANGGGAASGGGLTLRATVGQPVVGVSGGPAFVLCAGFWCFGGSRVVSVDEPPGDPAADLPQEISFGLPSPTPSRGDVSFAVALPAAAEVSLTVFDVSGRQVGETVSQRLDAGHHRLFWRASARHSGVYFGLIAVDGAVQARRRIILVR